MEWTEAGRQAVHKRQPRPPHPGPVPGAGHRQNFTSQELQSCSQGEGKHKGPKDCEPHKLRESGSWDFGREPPEALPPPGHRVQRLNLPCLWDLISTPGSGDPWPIQLYNRYIKYTYNFNMHKEWKMFYLIWVTLGQKASIRNLQEKMYFLVQMWDEAQFHKLIAPGSHRAAAKRLNLFESQSEEKS